MTEVAALGLRVDGVKDVDKATSSLKGFTKAADGADDSSERLAKGSRGATTAVKSTGEASARSSRDLTSLATAARVAAGAFLALAAAGVSRQLFRDADAWKSVNNQLRQVTETESELIGVRQQLLAVSRATNSELGSTVDLYSNLYRSTRDLGLAQGEVAEITRTINNLFLAGGKSAAETAGAVRQLAQGLAAGALRGDEFNSVAEGAPRIMDALAEKLQMTRGELREFAATGGITAEILTSALSDYSEEAQRMADITERTFSMSMVNARTNMLEFAGSLDTANGAIARAGESIEDFTAYLASGQAAKQLESFTMQFEQTANNAVTSFEFILDYIDDTMLPALNTDANSIGGFFKKALANLPTNVATTVKLMTVEWAALIDGVRLVMGLVGSAFIDQFEAIVGAAGVAGKHILTGLNPFSEGGADFRTELAEALSAPFKESFDQAMTQFDTLRQARRESIVAIVDEHETQIDAIDRTREAAARLRLEWENASTNAGGFGDLFPDDLFNSNAGATMFDGIAEGAARAVGEIEKLGEEAAGISDGFSFGELERGLGTTVNELSKIQGAMEDGSKGARKLEDVMTALSVAQGAAAIANAMASGDPYTAVLRAVAVAATLSAAGIETGVSGGGSTVAADAQASQGTGSVLGDTAAKSESIANAIDMQTGLQEELVGINRAQLTALQSLQQGIAGASNMILRGGNSLPGAGPNVAFDDQLSGIFGGFIGDRMDTFRDPLKRFTGLELDFVGDWLDDILGGSSDVINEGVAIAGGRITDLINNTVVSAFQDVEEKKNFLDDKDVRRYSEQLGSEVSDQFSLVFGSMVDAVSASAEILGVTQAEIDSRIAQFRVAATEISLKDLDGAEQQAELEAVFSTIFDGLAAAVIPFAAKFQEAGEGIAETAVRIASQVQVVDEAMSQLGSSLTEGLSGEALAKLSDELVRAGGGLDSFISGFTGFVNAFATDEHKLMVATNSINNGFEQLGLGAVPQTEEALWALMQTVTDPAQLTGLFNLTDAFKTYFDALEDQAAAADAAAAAAEQAAQAERDLAAERRREAISATDTALVGLRSAIDTQIARATSDFNAATAELDSQYERRVASANRFLESQTASYERSIERVGNSISALSELSGQISSAMNANIQSSDSQVIAQRAAAQQDLLSALETARAGGNVGDISGTLAALSQVSGGYSSQLEMDRDLGVTANRLQELGELTDSQLSAEQRTLSTLQARLEQAGANNARLLNRYAEDRDAQKAELKALYDAEVEGYNALYQAAEDQVNILRGIDITEKSIDEKLGELNTAMGNEFGEQNISELQAIRQELKRLNEETKAAREENRQLQSAIAESTRETANETIRQNRINEGDAA